MRRCGSWSDRESRRLHSSHTVISYAVFCVCADLGDLPAFPTRRSSDLLASPGFLDGFDAFVYTRTGVSIGQSLSVDAAANVKAYVRRSVLLNGDFADSVASDAAVRQLVRSGEQTSALQSHSDLVCRVLRVR